MEITLEQNKVIQLGEGQHLVLAPPGTGKTEILVRRLSNAVENGVKESDMICLTFTNRAAKNMTLRVEENIGEHNIFIGNIHGFCNVFLRKFRILPQITSLMDEEDSNLIMKECKIGSQLAVNELLILNTYINQDSYGFDKLLLNQPDFKYNEDDISACVRYENIKKTSNLLDFDDLLTLTYYYLENNLLFEFNQYKWLQVDEVQDLNPLQWAIINKLFNKDISHRVFFGDIDQSIFSFMGAKLEVLDTVAKDCQVHYLRNNFRSSQNLLDLYNTYAQEILSPKWNVKPISSSNEFTQDPLSYAKFSNEYEEVDWISKMLVSSSSIEETTAILVRTNKSADLFANKLSLYNLDYFKISGFDLFQRNIIKDVLAFLNIIIDNSNKNAWTRNLYLFGKMNKILDKSSEHNELFDVKLTRSDARNFTNELFNIGLNPLDFIKSKISKVSYLDDFQEYLEEERIVVFDTETTGLDTANDDVIQIAAIEIINGIVGKTFEVYIDTNKDLGLSEKVHKISKEFLLKNSSDKVDALNLFLDFIGNDIIVAHNITFDLKVLNSNLSKFSLPEISSSTNKMYDSIEIIKRLYPSLSSYKLEFLLKELNIEGVNSHNALDDVRATLNLIVSEAATIKGTSIARFEFINSHKELVENFSDSFSPLYEALENNFTEDMSMDEILDMVVSYLHDHLNYKIDPNVYHDIEKLKKHMKVKCILNNSFETLQKYIPEYTKYKESDIVLDNEKIVIATVHKAKGLEFDNVIIPGCTDDNYPSYFSKKEGREKILEDARLLYVAMTRTKKRLLITSPDEKIVSSTNGVYTFPQIKSRFLKPIFGMFNIIVDDYDDL